MDGPQIVYPSVDVIWAILCNIAMDIYAQVFLRTHAFISVRSIPGSGITGSQFGYMFVTLLISWLSLDNGPLKRGINPF